ncbi:hypothetical protein HZB04_03355 [Candidatus Wolfebacteria bacterium]|nr:hypothetical protein [Candidatus Wolfebacteria bacterium]
MRKFINFIFLTTAPALIFLFFFIYVYQIDQEKSLKKRITQKRSQKEFNELNRELARQQEIFKQAVQSGQKNIPLKNQQQYIQYAPQPRTTLS